MKDTVKKGRNLFDSNAWASAEFVRYIQSRTFYLCDDKSVNIF